MIQGYRDADLGDVLALARGEGFVIDPAAEAARPHALLLVARARATSEVQGYLLAWRVADEIELLQLVVQPSWRGQGIGAALVDQLLDRGAALGATAIHLEVRPSNVPALALYRSRGFVEQTRRRSYYSDGEDAVVFSRQLRP